MKRTLVIGLDAADRNIIEQLCDEGEMTNIEHLINEGASGDLRSTTPPMTPLAWTSMATGVNPGKHGIFDFVTQQKNGYKIVPEDYSKMSRPAVWDLLNQNGLNVGVVNFPMAFPPQKVDSFFISGIPTPDSAEIAYPEHIQNYIDKSGFRINPKVSNGSTEDYFQELKDLTSCQLELVKDTTSEHDIQFMWTVFMALDWAQHYLWGEKIDGEDAVKKFYKYIDEVVGELLDFFEDWTVLVVSDHGAGEIKGEIHLNNLLEKWGYLYRTNSEKDSSQRNAFTEKILRSIAASLPDSSKYKMRKLLPSWVIKAVERKSGFVSNDLHQVIDWKRSEAFSFGAMGRIYINSEKSYPKGIVDQSDYEYLREEIIQNLESVKHPDTGETIVDWAAKREDIYEGGHTKDAPDIIFKTVGWEYTVYGDFGDEWIHQPEKRFADHRENGLYILHGEDVENNTINAHVNDITPTILHYHGLPVLEDMDGRVLAENLTTDKNIEYIDSSRTAREKRNRSSDQDVTDRLEDLGYL